MKIRCLYLSIFILAFALCLLSFVSFEDEPCDGIEVDNYPYMCKGIDSLSPIGDYNSIDMGLNTIGGDTTSLSKLYDKLLRIKKGSDEVVSILHIGDSHIQGGYFTNKTRDLLASEFGFAGNGLIMPYRIIKTNGELDYSIKSVNDWTKYDITRYAQRAKAGFTGYTIESSNKAVEFVINSDSSYNLVRVLHGEKSPLLMVEPSLADLTIPNIATTESTDILLNRGVNSVVLRGRVWNEYNNHSYYGFILENGKPGVLYHTLGVNGACFKHYNDSTKFKSLSILDPDLIVVSLGTNDSFYTPIKDSELKSDIREVVSNLKKIAPQSPIILTTPVENFRNYSSSGRARKEPNIHIDNVSNIIESVVVADSLLLWDFRSVMGGKGSSNWLTQKGVIRRDGIHFTVEGYEIQGELLYDAIARGYNSYIQGL